VRLEHSAKDRALLEEDPFAIVEAMTIAGFATGAVRGYLNRCPHAWTELDWNPGEFFDQSGLNLVCSTHGAIFEPGTGYCVAGPCRGASLEPLELREQDGRVLLLNDDP